MGTSLISTALGQAPMPEGVYDRATGLRILPGAWRPHYPWEHIAWISPSWFSQDYLWLDFPEAIFTDRGLLYLSHASPYVPTAYDSLPRVEWRIKGGAIAYERTLPHGVFLAGKVYREKENIAALELRIKNGSKEPLRKIRLQTCAYLRAIKEFDDFSLDNKYVHVPDRGWIRLNEAQGMKEDTGKYEVGLPSDDPFTHENHKADVPMIVTVSNMQPEFANKPLGSRLVAMTWRDATLAMWGNPGHPCMHADPFVPDLQPGQEHTIRGRIIFFEGGIKNFPFQDEL